jgi:TrmH family RNA methyltransferase
MTYTISSLQNPTVKNLVKLRQRRERDAQQCFLIDGARLLYTALRAGWPLDTIYCTPTAAQMHANLLAQARAHGTHLQAVTDTVFQKIGYGDHPDGLLGLAWQPHVSLPQLPHTAVPLYLITEGLEKPGNLGAILRSADAAGVTGVIVCDNQLDLWNPNVIRASQGACFTVPLARASGAETLQWLHSHDVQLLAATPTASQLYTQVNMRLPTALVVGAEHSGLSAAWRCSTCVRIPMAGQVDSLNVAQAASILLFEAVRQRQEQEITPTPG